MKTSTLNQHAGLSWHAWVTCAVFGLVSMFAMTSRAGAAELPAVELLYSGKLQEATVQLSQRLRAEPGDDHARFALGMTRFLQGVEQLAQAGNKYGFHSPMGGGFAMWLGFMPNDGGQPNAKPAEPINYDMARAILQRWHDQLLETQDILSQIKDPTIKIPVKFGQVRLDFNGDGQSSEDESLWRLYYMLNRGAMQADPQGESAKQFVIAFDAADAKWLEGYCHLLMAIAQFKLAYDQHELFDRTAHLFLANPQTPYAFLRPPAGPQPRPGGFDVAQISDVIALIHLVNFPLTDGKRMGKAHEHLVEMVKCSRQMWKLSLAETDDDQEWIPNPKQTGVIPNVRVTPEMVQGWMTFLDEADALLAGDKLIPFWRNAPAGQGVNLKKFFAEPRPFDLVLWVQGSAAAPYLEEGPLTQPDTWQRLQMIFQGNFIGFALWFN